VGKPGLRNTAHSLFLACCLFPAVSQAAHPLITEDTGTQGRGRFQLELTTEHGYRDEDHAAEHERQFAVTFSWGARDDLDVIFTLPYQRVSPQANGGIETHSGISDVGVDAKWRFLENDKLSMALKPGITFPTGDEAVGLGSGKSASSLFLVTTIEPEPWALHLHLGTCATAMSWMSGKASGMPLSGAGARSGKNSKSPAISARTPTPTNPLTTKRHF
jgi:hypothetical protein